MKTILPVYHADSKTENDKFIANKKLLLASKEDGYWCGEGMYFWDNKSNAKYWLEKIAHRKPSKRSICLARLQYEQDDCLDMTDKESAERLISVAKEMLIKMDPDERPNLNMHEIGAVINFVHNGLQKRGFPAFNVVKMSGLYNKRNQVFNEWYKNAHATLRTKTIYSVRNGELLTERSEVS